MELTVERCAVECLHPQHVGPLIGKVIRAREAEAVVATFDLLADPTRVRILHALSLAAELCVCDLAWLLGLSQSGLSHQLRLLRERRIVERQRAGRVVYYRLRDRHVRRLLADGLRHSAEHAPARERRRGEAS
ncbi:MAG: helix-turn-helix transcriptional regulator [Elusimicrobia bacterium]|nr:helix-turn-helix transcriptional regulator [Elusimicrobiota bacterium]